MSLIGLPSQYLLPVLNSALAVDLLFIYLAYSKYGFGSHFLRSWYLKYRLSAVIGDVLILVIGFILTALSYSYIWKTTKFDIIKFLVLLIGIQVIHDLLFAFMFTVIPRGYNEMLDMFKEYAGEVGWKAILGDSSMIALTFGIALLFTQLSFEQNLIALVFLAYLTPYILYIN